MAIDIGPKIGIDGEKQFRQELKNVNQSLKTLDSEMKVVTSSFSDQKKSEEQLRKENDVLERSALTLRDKLKMQEDALAKSVQKYGEADEKTMKWRQAVNETTAALNKAENQIKENTNAINNLGNEEDDAGSKTSKFGETFKGVFAGNLLTSAIKEALELIKKIGGAMLDITVDAAVWSDDLNTLAKITGLTTRELQEFGYMAEFIDVDMDTLTGSMAKLVKNMGNAQRGTGNAQKAFEKLGISITDDTDALRDNYDVFLDAIDALGAMTNETERDALAMDIFGKSAQDLNPLIIAGAEAMRGFAAEAEAAGLVYSQEELDKLNAFNDEMDTLKKRFTGLKTDAALAFIDEFGGAIDKATGFVDGLRAQIGEEGLTDTIIELGDKVYDLLNPFGLFDEAIAGARNAVRLIRGDIDLATAVMDTYKDAINRVKDAWQKLKDLWASGASIPGGGLGGGNTASNVREAIENNSKIAHGTTVNVYPKSMTLSEFDYIVNMANNNLGGELG